MLTSATMGETLTPNPNECNSTLMSGTNNIYPCPYIDVNDQGHHLRITHKCRRSPIWSERCNFLSIFSNEHQKVLPVNKSAEMLNNRNFLYF